MEENKSISFSKSVKKQKKKREEPYKCLFSNACISVVIFLFYVIRTIIEASSHTHAAEEMREREREREGESDYTYTCYLSLHSVS
jgi:hypothetical protein